MTHPVIDALIDDFSKLPGIGRKTARRLVFNLLTKKLNLVEKLAEDLTALSEGVGLCPECGFVSGKEGLCPICQDSGRERTLLVVSSIEDEILFSDNTEFKGYFHVLNGLISPVNGITPSIAGVDRIVERIGQRVIGELIIALPTSSDGMITTVYLKNLVREKYPGIAVTQLAQGIPQGKSLDELTPQTIHEALKRRERMDGNG